MDFEADIIKMLDFYFETEKQFIELARIIPVSNPPNTHSPILYNILQSSCGQVENLLRILCERFELKYGDEKKFPKYYELLNHEGILQSQTIYFIKIRKSFKPFAIQEGDETPFWWKAYNSTKHKLPEGLEKGNLENTIHSLIGLYALHCMAYYAMFESTNLFKKSHWVFVHEPIFLPDGRVIRTVVDNKPISEIFYSQSRFQDSGEGL